jgi:spore germination cell wall hydrolase CwlJ-like protein
MINLIDEDALAICTIWQEAEGEPFIAKVGVGEVIRERARRKYNCDGSITGAIAKRFQFSSWNDDQLDNDRLIASLKLNLSDQFVQECLKAWYQSQNTVYARKAVLFVNKDISQPAWATTERLLVKMGKLSFYKD